MGSYSYRGKTTLRLYTWMQQTIPSALLNIYGQPVQSAPFNGEQLVLTNHDGSVALPLATGPPPGAVTTQPATPSELNSIYDAYTTTTPWQETP